VAHRGDRLGRRVAPGERARRVDARRGEEDQERQVVFDEFPQAAASNVAATTVAGKAERFT
jgi:hypothetical protein